MASIREKNETRRTAFTLVELLVVIAIISVLAALLLPALEDALESARRAACASQQKQLHLSASLYADDFDNGLPMNGYANADGTSKILVKPSQKIWVHDYLEIPLYDRAVAYGGVEVSDYLTRNFYGVYLPTTQNILWCPSTNWVSHGGRIYSSNYFAAGFGGSSWVHDFQFNSEDYHNYTRLDRVAEPITIGTQKGVEKILFRELGWALGYAYQPILLNEIQAHCPGEAVSGSNIALANGSVRWLPFSSEWALAGSGWWVSPGAGYCAITGGTKDSFGLTSPTGGSVSCRRGYTDITGTNWDKYAKKWGIR